MLPLPVFKNYLAAQCKAYFRDDILQTNDVHTQLNILMGLEGDLATLKSAIQSAKQEFQVLQGDLQSLNDTALATNFHTDSDENMKAFVVQHLPNLTTDRQKLAVIIALQDRRLK